MTAPIERNPALTFPLLLDRLAKKFGNAPALLSSNQTLSYRSLAEKSHQYAHWALSEGLSPGERICLLMPNSPEYFAIWLGIARVGGVACLVNTNLSGDALARAVTTVSPRHLIVGESLVKAFLRAAANISREIKVWAHGAGEHALPRIEEVVARFETAPPRASEYKPPTIADQALYIYTSGTTGLPQAAKVSHFRVMQWSHWFAGMMDARADDRMYDCLPMYHSVGGVVAIGAMLVSGGAVVLRERFSARRFWKDIVESNCTVFQYIGELCRYLVNSPPDRQEHEHHLRLACGNGMHGDVWEEFQRRFRIPRILEFYASTEGNLSLYNCEGKARSIGRIPSFLEHRSSIALIKLDPENSDPIRDAHGRCIRCATDEVGEAIGRILAVSRASHFEGYADQTASEKKVLRNVFTVGDAWFRSGDLMRRDGQGFFYFVDRLGDSFRWKSENVSTTEVAAVICACVGVADAIVYGVGIPGTEGRAGMAAVVPREGFELAALRRHLAEQLPAYAQPLFVRIRDKLEATSTFKTIKRDLVRESYDPTSTTEPIYFNDPIRKAFIRLDVDTYEAIRTGQVPLSEIATQSRRRRP